MVVTDRVLAWGEPKCSDKEFDDVIALHHIAHVDELHPPVAKEDLPGTIMISFHPLGLVCHFLLS